MIHSFIVARCTYHSDKGYDSHNADFHRHLPDRRSLVLKNVYTYIKELDKQGQMRSGRLSFPVVVNIGMQPGFLFSWYDGRRLERQKAHKSSL